MSAKDCILGKAEAGKVDRDRAQEAADLFDRLEAENAGRMGAADASARAGQDAAATIEKQLARETANRLRMARMGNDIAQHIKGFRDGFGKPQPGRAAIALLSRDLGDRAAGISNVEARAKVVLGTLHAIAEQTLETLRPRAAGLYRNKARVNNVVRELFGEATGDEAAAAAAKAWSAAAEAARVRFNGAGGAIAKRADWGLPQRHDAVLVRKAGKQAWRDFIRERLDRTKMLDHDTGRPLDDMRFEMLLDQTWERIRTNGLIDLEPGYTGRGRPSLANTRQEARFLVFRDADAWLEYQARFGSADLHGSLMGHLDDMAMDIARLEILGPNPRAMLGFIKQTVEREAALGDLPSQAIPLGELRAIDEEQTGLAMVPGRPRVAAGFQALRNVLTSAQLGSAALSAITDWNFQQMARGLNGLPGVQNMLLPVLRLMNPADLADQRLAVRMGLVGENWASVAIAQGRYFGETIGPNWSRLFADVVLRATLLSPWTQAGRHAFGLEFLGHLADHVGKGFDAMPAATARALARYGIDQERWLRIGAQDLTEHRGAAFLDSRRLYERDPELANRVMEMILTETEMAVPSVSDRVRSQLRLGLGERARPGTIAGELVRSGAMYKSFPVTLIHMQIMRGLRMAMPRGQRARYWAQLIIGLTVMGGVAMQAKNIAKGRDPQDMTTGDFWMAAAAQGGGLGIFGDFLFSDVNRVGGSPIATAGGPVVKFADDLTRLTVGNIQQAIGGDKTNVGREAVAFAERYQPGGSIWWARLAMERLIWDELLRMADPDAERRFRDEQRRALRERGQRFFWRPGQSAPDRMPNFDAAIGG